MEREHVVGAVADHRAAIASQALHELTLLGAVADPPRGDSEHLCDPRRGSERVRGDELDLDEGAQPAHAGCDTVGEHPAVGQRAVEVEEQVLELERRASGEWEDDRHWSTARFMVASADRHEVEAISGG